jgi:hypothetical protein
LLDRIDIALALHRDPVLGTFQLGDEGHEGSIGFELGVVLRHRQQTR